MLFIVNPASGGGKAGREWATIESWLPSTGLRFEVARTTGPLDAMEIARAAVRQSRPVVVAVGGDGTLNEVVNGFFHNGAPIPTTSRMAMVPIGTGGDFRRTLQIPLDHRAAIDVITKGVPRRLDVGAVTFQANDGTTQTRHFINIADAGWGGDVVHSVNAGKKRSGGLTFTLTALMTLFAYRNKPMHVIVDGEAHDVVAQQVVVANCQYFGGGMKMAPTASPTDGVFDVIIVGDAGKIETLRGMSQIREGRHLDDHNPKISVLYGKRIEVTSSKPVRIDVDGEDPGMLPAVFEMQPGSIEFLTPR
ncbi:MAG TPA: diacylglycerol kinase family protein [Candidatus Dormibacteraeota bacterium]|nr:diacylglycerol kinase family protein [Candidatus Dormibacteraeota bacterium]